MNLKESLNGIQRQSFNRDEKNNIFVFTNVQLKFSFFPYCECRQETTVELVVPFIVNRNHRHFLYHFTVIMDILKYLLISSLTFQ